MSRPNILFIMADQFRGDCLGAAGHPDVKTPYLDSLAAKGVMFDNAYTACPSCVPARASVLTGLSPKSHGRVGYTDGVPWNYEHTLAGELSANGYYPQCVGKMHVHPQRSLQGFHNIELHDGYLHYYRSPDTPYSESQRIADDYLYWLQGEKGIGTDITDTGLECNSWLARPWIYEEKYHPTNWAASRSIDFFRRRDPEKPFILMTSFVRPHPPFDAPQYYLDMYLNRELREPVCGGWADTERIERQGRIYDSLTGPEDRELVRQAQAGYYACITHLDHQIGRIIGELIERKLYDNTLIVFTSDHGEQLCDHRFFRKSLPYQGSVHIPLIISGGALDSRFAGTRCSALAELRDILPTFVDAAGGLIPETVEGKSLLNCLENGGKLREYIHGEHSYGELSNHFIVTERDKYIWFSHSGREQYFRLDSDPQELCDLKDDPSCGERIAYLRSLLIAELDGREEGFTDGHVLIPGRKTKPCLDSVFHREENK